MPGFRRTLRELGDEFGRQFERGNFGGGGICVHREVLAKFVDREQQSTDPRHRAAWSPSQLRDCSTRDAVYVADVRRTVSSRLRLCLRAAHYNRATAQLRCRRRAPRIGRPAAMLGKRAAHPAHQCERPAHVRERHPAPGRAPARAVICGVIAQKYLQISPFRPLSGHRSAASADPPRPARSALPCRRFQHPRRA